MNGAGAVQLPPIDPGNTFVLQRSEPDRLELLDSAWCTCADCGTGDREDRTLYVTTEDVAGASDPMWQTIVPGTMGDGTRVLVITWRVGPGTITVRLTREDTVRLGRALIAAGGPAASLVITGPGAVVSVEVRVELDGCAVRMRWARKDCDTLGRSIVQAGQAAPGLIVPAPGIHP